MRIAHVANTDYFCAFLLLGQLRALRRAGFAVDVVCGPGPLTATLEAEGFRVHGVENARRVDALGDLRTLRAYLRLFRRERYELVHTHNPKVNLLAALAARVAGVPRVVSTVHGLYSHEGQRPVARAVWRGFEAASARLADLVLCQSGEDVRTARWRRIVPDARLRSLGNGIDLARFRPGRLAREDRDALRRRLGVRRGEKALGFVGRLVREKGVEDLLAAVAGQRGWRVLLIGPDERGAKDDALQPERWMGEGPVRWLGLQPDMPPLYAALDLAVLPSWREGFPRSLLEAAASALPIVATRIRGCREAVEDGSSGLLVPPRSPRDLRQALEALASDPARRRHMGRVARARAERAFDEEAVFERIVRAYREIPLPATGLPLHAPAAGRATA